MTRVKFGVGVAGFSGSDNRNAGGQTFQKNNVVRTRSVPFNPQSASQSLYRNMFKYISAAWLENLTDAQRQLWAQAAASGNWNIQDNLMGVPRQPTAKQLFIELNVNYNIHGGTTGAPTVQTDVPIQDAPNIIGGLSAVVDASAQTVIISHASGDVGGSDTVVIRATPPMPATSLKLPQAKMRNVDTILTGGYASPYDASTAYLAKYGALTATAGKVIFLEVWVYHSDSRKYLAGTLRVIVQA